MSTKAAGIYGKLVIGEEAAAAHAEEVRTHSHIYGPLVTGEGSDPAPVTAATLAPAASIGTEGDLRATALEAENAALRAQLAAQTVGSAPVAIPNAPPSVPTPPAAETPIVDTSAGAEGDVVTDAQASEAAAAEQAAADQAVADAERRARLTALTRAKLFVIAEERKLGIATSARHADLVEALFAVGADAPAE